MNRLLTAALLACAGGAAAVDLGPASKLAGSHEFLTYENRTTGANISNSFLTPGKHTVDSFNLLFTAKPSTVAWESALDGRLTDDARVDAKRVNLKRLYLKGETERTSAIVGDYFASLSEYTLGKSLKGAQYTGKLGETTQLTVLAGLDKPNWDDVWNHNRGETVDRQVYGLRVQRTFHDDGQVGANFVASKDERARFNDTDIAVDQRIYSVDWQLPRYKKLTLSGESAYAFSQHDQPSFDENGQPYSAHTTSYGQAHKVRARYSWRRFKTVDDFERVSPEFETTGGSASPDLIKVKTANTLTISGPWKWIVLNYTYYHNGLARQEGANISTTRMPETGLKYEAPDWRPDFSIETRLRHREATSTQKGLRRRTRSVISSASDRFGPVSVSVDYEYQHEDRSDGASSLRHHIFGAGTNFFKQWGDWKVTQGLHYDLQRDRDNLVPMTDQSTTIRANLNLVSPWAVDGGLTFSRALVLNAQNPGNDRRTWLASLGYNILRKENHRVELRYKQNDNRFQAPDQDFKEMTWELALSDKF